MDVRVPTCEMLSVGRETHHFFGTYIAYADGDGNQETVGEQRYGIKYGQPRRHVA